jgi:hypothetical protein
MPGLRMILASLQQENGQYTVDLLKKIENRLITITQATPLSC